MIVCEENDLKEGLIDVFSLSKNAGVEKSDQ